MTPLLAIGFVIMVGIYAACQVVLALYRFGQDYLQGTETFW